MHVWKNSERLWLAMLLPILVLVAIFASGYLWNEDFYWYLTSGRAILEHGGIPEQDPFLYTSEGGIGWVYHSWLWTVIVAGFERLGGLDAVVFFHVLVGLALAALIYLKNKTDRLGLLNALATLLFLITLRHRLCGKAEMASWLLLAVFFYLLERRTPWTYKRVAGLGLLQILWANLHGGYPLGIFIALCYSLGGGLERRWSQRGTGAPARPPLWLPAMLFVLALADPRMAAERLVPFAFVWGGESVNPIGASGTKLLLEWRSPFHPSITDASLPWLYLAALAAGAAGLLVGQRRDLPRWLFFFGMAALGASAIRHMSGFALAAALVSLASLSEAFAAKAERKIAPEVMPAQRKRQERQVLGKAGWRPPAWLYPASCILLGTIVSSAAAALAMARNGFEGEKRESFYAIQPKIAAQGAADFILENDLPGPIFNDFPLGAYLSHRLYPKHRLFVDSRVINPSVVVEYTKMLESVEAWEQALRRYEFETVVLGHYSLTVRSAIGTALQRDPGWRLVYSDPLAVVFTRDTRLAAVERPTLEGGKAPFLAPPAPAPLAALQRVFLNDTPGNYLVEYLGNLGFLGRPGTVIELASQALESQPNKDLLYQRRCAANLSLNAVGNAISDCESAYRLRPGDPLIATLLATALHKSGSAMQARAVLEASLRLNPDNRQLRQMLGSLRG